jgi:hypothetical protein
MALPIETMRIVRRERRKNVLILFIAFTSDDVAKKNLGCCSPGVIKKTFTPRHDSQDKGLVGKISALVPGLSTVLTESRSAFFTDR